VVVRHMVEGMGRAMPSCASSPPSVRPAGAAKYVRPCCSGSRVPEARGRSDPAGQTSSQSGDDHDIGAAGRCRRGQRTCRDTVGAPSSGEEGLQMTDEAYSSSVARGGEETASGWAVGITAA